MDATTEQGMDEECSWGDTILSCPDEGHILLTGVILTGPSSEASGL